MDRRRPRKRGKSRAELEKYLVSLMAKCESGDFVPTEFDKQIIQKIGQIYDAFLEKVEATQKEPTPGQKLLIQNWAKLLERDIPAMAA